jgi:hypothetical protein
LLIAFRELSLYYFGETVENVVVKLVNLKCLKCQSSVFIDGLLSVAYV